MCVQLVTFHLASGPSNAREGQRENTRKLNTFINRKQKVFAGREFLKKNPREFPEKRLTQACVCFDVFLKRHTESSVLL